MVMVLLAVAAGLALVVLLAGGWFFARTSVRGVAAPAMMPARVPARVPMAGSGFAAELSGGADADYVSARAATEFLLDDLLAGGLDADAGLGAVAQKVKGYRAWSVTSQRKSEDVPLSWTFSGTMEGPGGVADFGVMMVRQRGGEWAVGTFRGPERK
jgi:hypothetical protein